MASRIDKKALEFLRNVSKSKRAKKQERKFLADGEVRKNQTNYVEAQEHQNVNKSNDAGSLTPISPRRQLLQLQETITTVSAVLSSELVHMLPNEQITQIAKGANITLDKKNDEYVITGSWESVQNVKFKLDRLKQTAEKSLAAEKEIEKEIAVKNIITNRDIDSDSVCITPNLELICTEEDDTDALEPKVKSVEVTVNSEKEKLHVASPEDTSSVLEAFLKCIDTDKYDGDNMITIQPKRGQVHRVLEKNPELATEVCGYCGYRSSKEGVTRHKQRRHSKIGFKCEVCNAVFGVRYDMRRHRLNHFTKEGKLNKKGQRLWDELHPGYDSEQVNYKDFEENFDYVTINKNKKSDDINSAETNIETSKIKYHQEKEEKKRLHAIKLEDIEFDVEEKNKSCKQKVRYPPRDTSMVDCPICGKKFPLKILPVHLKIHKKKEELSCEYCAKKFWERGKLNSHVRTTHEKRFKCDHCDMSLSSHIALTNHLSAKHDVKKAFDMDTSSEKRDGQFQVECTICTKYFRTRTAMLIHQRKIHGSKQFVCEICKRGFFERRALDNHRITHLDEEEKEEKKKFICSYCPKKFLVKSTLKMHENIHTGNKPFRCDVPGCDKGFAYASMLNKHKKSHSSEKNFQCGVCHKGFKFPYKLRHHMILHTGERTHACPTCGKYFTTSTTLKLHNCRGRIYQPVNLNYSAGTINMVSMEDVVSSEQVINTIIKQDHHQERKDAAVEVVDQNTGENHLAPINATESHSTIYVCGFCNVSFDNMDFINEHIQLCHNYDNKMQNDDTSPIQEDPSVSSVNIEQVEFVEVIEEPTMGDHLSIEEGSYVHENILESEADMNNKTEIENTKYLQMLTEKEGELLDISSMSEKDKESEDENVQVHHGPEVIEAVNTSSIKQEDMIVSSSGTEFVIRINPDLDNVTKNVEVSHDT